MQPLKPEDLESIRQEHPQASPGDLGRYEKLLSQRFAVDPDRPQPAPKGLEGNLAEEEVSTQSIEAELAELHQRLFAKNEDQALRIDQRSLGTVGARNFSARSARLS